MSIGDGILAQSEDPIINLVRFGNVSPKSFNNIHKSLNNFIYSLKEELDYSPQIMCSCHMEPVVEFQGDEEITFNRKLRNLPGYIVLGVTDLGIYSRPVNRNIFGFGGSGKGLLSTYRFVHTTKSANRINERLAKEIIKILSLSTGLSHCFNPDCILTYHRSVADLDHNHEVCESCKKHLIKSLNSYGI